MQTHHHAVFTLALVCASLFSSACDLDNELSESVQLRGGPKTVEIFKFSTPGDVIANTAASDNAILAPWPAGVGVLDEPQISSGVMIATKIHDANDQLIGFGTEQGVVDMVDASSQNTYTLTLPGRGTLMLGQVEDFTPVFAELYDMLANEDLVRSYDPPWQVLTTAPGTGRIIGGTGEFAGARGTWTELDITHEFNLEDRTFDIDVVLEVTFEHRRGHEDEDEDED